MARVSPNDPCTRGDSNNKGVDRVPSRVTRTLVSDGHLARLNDHRVEVLMTCPKCGETRLIERVDAYRWFCAVCAHLWMVGTKDVSREA
jgi:ribosomal protein L37AE/L43A